MLVEFSVENYRSIKDKKTLSFVAANGDEHPDNVFIAGIEKIRLLKTLLVYGPNASGKSNLLKAFRDFVRFISISNKINLNESIPFFLPYYFDEKTLTESVSFSIEFISVDNIRYLYTVNFTMKKVVEEKLSYFPIGNERKLFHRLDGEEIDFGSSLTGEKKSIEKQLLPQHLFLTKAANSNHEQLKPVYNELCNQNKVMLPLIFEGENISKTQSRIIDKSINMKKLTELLMIADPSVLSPVVKKKAITDLPQEVIDLIKSFAKLEGQSDEINLGEVKYNSIINQTFFIHKNIKNNINPLITLADESLGLQKIFGLAPDIIEAIEEGNTLVIDEISSSLHPLIALEIIKMFNSSQANPKNAQLLASTHDVTLLDPDLLRRDQIWFTEKNDDNATELFSLADFPSKEVRKDTPFDKWYLSGKFGAIPVVKDIQL